MSSFVFNSFKKRFLNGEIPSKDTWTFIPVNSAFKDAYEKGDAKLEQYRSISDFKDVDAKTFGYTTNTETQEHLGEERKVDMASTDLLVSGIGLIEGEQVSYNWYKKIYEEQLDGKPFFVNSENYENFKMYFSDSIKGNGNIDNYIEQGGFYYIRSLEEFNWFASRSTMNNRIIGVFGTDITGIIENYVGSSEEYPFNGILDGNFYKFDITIKAKNNDNGLVGILGPDGIIRNFILVNDDSSKNAIECEKQINLTYIKKDGRDINCGLLVGKNYGTIENIAATGLQNFNLSGFVPAVYSVTNKSDKYKWNETDEIVREKFDYSNENFMYLNSYCINSPGNICPYVGYFNEGKFADDGCALNTDINSIATTATPNLELQRYSAYMANWGVLGTGSPETPETPEIRPIVPPDHYNKNVDWSFYVDNTNNTLIINYRPLGNFYANNSATTAVTSVDLSQNLSNFENNSALMTYVNNPLYYGFDTFGYYTVRGVGQLIPASTISISPNVPTFIENYNSNLTQQTLGDEHYKHDYWLKPSYETTRCSMRLHQKARAAYNVGVLVGNNENGTIQNVELKTTIKNTSNFVGFIGGLVGKQSNGFINNCSIDVKNELVYEFGGSPEKGDVVYYKQTPIFPKAIQNIIDNEVSDTFLYKKNLIDWYCKAWYTDDNQLKGYSCNTAKIVTDDVVSYKLRPIFIVGGLFGRFVPSFETGLLGNKYCNVLDTTVIYQDNTSDTQTIEKRPENSFGVIAGKVDYTTTTNSVLFGSNMLCNNCNFSASKFVGEPVLTIENNYNDVTNEWEPVLEPSGQGHSALNISHSYRRYVGVYELKYNVMDSISYLSVYKSMDSSAYDPAKKSLSEDKIFWASDYPISFEDHDDGIVKSHDMLSYIVHTPEVSGDLFSVVKWNNRTGEDGTVSQIVSNYDINHKYYPYPNYDPNEPNVGRNKRNVASKLISLVNCHSNVDNWIQVYDDYLNTWNYMKLPEPSAAGAGSDYKQEDYYNNSFDEKEIYIITKYWNKYRTNYDGLIETDQSDYLNWDDSKCSYANNSAIFTNGILSTQLNFDIIQGTQNTFDGYTTVNYAQTASYSASTAFRDSVINFKYDESKRTPYTRNTYCSAENIYTNPRRFVKNIMPHYNLNWVEGNQRTSNIQFESRLTTFPERKKQDYYQYTYDMEYGLNNKIHSKSNNLTNAFAFSLPVKFNVDGTDYGYSTNSTEDERLGLESMISIGQYVSNDLVKFHVDELNIGEKYTTTSISSTDKAGGLLVVDSSGRNVMFLQDDNNTDLTGNAITVDAQPISINNVITEKFILKV